MLNTIVAAADRIVVAAGGAINDPDSALFHPTFKYTNTQLVGGIVIDAVITVSLLAAMFYAAWKYWGPPSRATANEDAVTLRSEGLLLGLQPWVWSLITMAALAIVVVASALFYS
jgi:hypothetical protein